MIVVNCKNDIQHIDDDNVRAFVDNLFDYIVNEYNGYCSNGNLETIGAIFVIESSDDFEEYTQFGLSSPITESRFEFVEDIGTGYYNLCIVIDNDKAINIISKTEDFMKYFGEVDI